MNEPNISKLFRSSQVHRSEMIRKFMHLERSEYWEASDADWLYSAIYDVDVITNKALLGGRSSRCKGSKACCHWRLNYWERLHLCTISVDL